MHTICSPSLVIPSRHLSLCKLTEEKPFLTAYFCQEKDCQFWMQKKKKTSRVVFCPKRRNRILLFVTNSRWKIKPICCWVVWVSFSQQPCIVFYFSLDFTSSLFFFQKAEDVSDIFSPLLFFFSPFYPKGVEIVFFFSGKSALYAKEYI